MPFVFVNVVRHRAIGFLYAAVLAPRRITGRWRSGLPAPLLECLSGIATGPLLLLPQLEELALLPPPLGFRRPLAHHVLVLARLDHHTSDFGTEDCVMALAA